MKDSSGVVLEVGDFVVVSVSQIGLIHNPEKQNLAHGVVEEILQDQKLAVINWGQRDFFESENILFVRN